MPYLPKFLRLCPILACLTVIVSAFSIAAESKPLDTLDEHTFRKPKEKGNVEIVEGHSGKAAKLSFDAACQNVFIGSRIKGAAEWDSAAGISFWVKGDGSDHLGGIQFVWNDDYGLRYGYAFRIDSTEWQKIVIPWRDLIPETSSAASKPLDPKNGPVPSKLGQLMFGKWWYWRDYAAHSYTVSDFQLESAIELDNTDYKPTGAALERVIAKLKAGKPVTIVTMGDSLTDYNHWTNKTTNWPMMLKAKLKERFNVEATIINPAIGGTELRQNEVMIPRWLQKAPEPDLVTICFGFNDWNSGMRGEAFTATQRDTVERVRRSTKGKADVLVITTNPAVDHWDSLVELADACRKAAKEENAGLADTYSAFHEAGKENKEHLYATDKVHLGQPGQALIAQTVLDQFK